jgi:transcription elongation factor/antiterminator RfaH
MSISTDIALAPARHSLCEGERWYVVYTQPHGELTAKFNLANQGFRTFLPKYTKTVRHARSLRSISAPLFSRYLFIVLNLDRDRWRSVNGSRGVSSLIMQQENPLPVATGIVETLLASSTDDGEVQFLTEMRAGGRVRLVGGPFAEQLGVIERLSDSGRVRVLLDIMSGQIPIETLKRDIIPIFETRSLCHSRTP